MMKNLLKTSVIILLFINFGNMNNGLCFSPAEVIRFFNQKRHLDMKRKEEERIPYPFPGGSFFMSPAGFEKLLGKSKKDFYNAQYKIQDKIPSLSPEMQKYLKKALNLEEKIQQLGLDRTEFFRKLAVPSAMCYWENSHKNFKTALRELTLTNKYLIKNCGVICSDNQRAGKLRTLLRVLYNMVKEQGNYVFLHWRTYIHWSNYKFKTFGSSSKQKIGAYNETLIDRKSRKIWQTSTNLLKFIYFQMFQEIK